MLFVSCELQEEAIKENERNENFKFSQKKFEELMTDKNFKSSFAKLQKNKNTSNSSVISRTIMEDMYGFTIADKPAKILQTNNFTTYTFLIQRDSLQSANYFENLVIKTDSLNNTQAVILKYTPFTPLVYLQNHNSSYFNGEVEGQFIIYNNQSSSQSRMVYGCEYSMGLICTGDSDGCGATAHPVTESCVYFTPGCISPTVLGMSCGFYDDGLGGSGGTSSSDSGSGGGSGGSSNGDTTEDIDLNDGHGGLTTVTVVPGEVDSPCNKLKNLFTNKDLKVKQRIINDLRPNIDENPEGEKAALLQKLPDGTTGSTILFPTSIGEIKIKTGFNFFSAIHTHPLTTFPMFSWSDVLTLKTMHDNLESHNTGLASFLLVCQDQNGVFQTYAIVFNNEGVNTLDLVFNSPFWAGKTPAEIAVEMNDRLWEGWINEEKNRTFDYAKVFLNQFSGSNVSLYKANSNLDNWSRLHINTATNNSMEIPCE